MSGFRDTIDSLFKGMDGYLAAKTVLGEPIQVGDATIVPLADVSFAVGAGTFGAAKGEKDGGGAGVKMNPCAVLVIQNGITRLVNIRNMDGVSKALDMVPDIMNRFMAGGSASGGDMGFESGSGTGTESGTGTGSGTGSGTGTESGTGFGTGSESGEGMTEDEMDVTLGEGWENSEV